MSDEIKFPEWVDISEEAKDFILNTMRKKGEERMDMKEILKHGFLTKAVEGEVDSKMLNDFKRVIN